MYPASASTAVLTPDSPRSEQAARLDQDDPLRGFRDEFVISDPDLVYLDGNSLGRLPRATEDLISDLVSHQWGDRLVRGWNESWFQLPQQVGAAIAGVIGASPEEVLAADSTSVNLYKLVTATLRARPERPRVVTDDLNFPSDLYVLQCAAGLENVTVVRSREGISVDVDLLVEQLDDDVALLVLSHTTFKSGFTYSLPEITRLAQRRGVWVLWDLSHSAGVVPIDLSGAGAEMAVGCTYKYLNGGPGAPAYLYLRRDLQSRLRNPLGGWFGQAKPFDFELEYQPHPDVRGFQCGTPPILSLAAVLPGVEMVRRAGVESIRAKSVGQTEYLVEAWQDRLSPLGYRLRSPRDPTRRGSHVSLGHSQAQAICQVLVDRYGVIPDFRTPDILRLGVSPLFTTYEELDRALDALESIVRRGEHLDVAPATGVVT